MGRQYGGNPPQGPRGYNRPSRPRQQGAPWPIIIILFFVFWPAGLVLLYLKVKKGKQASSAMGRIFRGIGIVLYVFTALCLMTFSSGDEGYICFFAMLATVFYVVGHKMVKRSKKTKQYIALIVNQHITSIDELARATGTTYEKACNELQQVIDGGFFPGACLNLSARRFIIPGAGAPIYREKMPQQGPRQGAKTRAASCKGCGAQIIVAVGAVRKCEYCGTPVQG